jgi:hypothetical protein
MQITEKQLRQIVNEIILEAARSPAPPSPSRIFVDVKGNKFQIRGGLLTLIQRRPGRPKGSDGLPIPIRDPRMSKRAAQTLLRNPANGRDAGLMALAGVGGSPRHPEHPEQRPAARVS